MTTPTAPPAPAADLDPVEVEAPPAPFVRPTAREILAALVDLPPLHAPGTVAPTLALAALVPVLGYVLHGRV